MTNRRIKKSVIYGVYCLGIVLLVGTIYLVESNISKNKFKDQEYSYVSKTIFDEVIPVVSTEEKISKPYADSDVKILKTYYNYQGEEKDQQDAIIYYENTYMQSNGVAYGKNETFEVLTILPGTVTDVRRDELLGKVVEIKHNENVTGIYQSLSDTTVQKGDTVIQGQSIGQSGTSSLEKDLKNHVYFELVVNGATVNPEEYYGKTINEL